MVNSMLAGLHVAKKKSYGKRFCLFITKVKRKYMQLNAYCVKQTKTLTYKTFSATFRAGFLSLKLLSSLKTFRLLKRFMYNHGSVNYFYPRPIELITFFSWSRWHFPEWYEIYIQKQNFLFEFQKLPNLLWNSMQYYDIKMYEVKFDSLWN